MNNQFERDIYEERDPLMTIEDVAAALNLSVPLLRKWRSTGTHKLMNNNAIKFTEKAIRWRREDVEDYIDSMKYEHH